MKKWTAVLLAVVMILSCVCLSACGLLAEFFNSLLGEDDNSHTHVFDSYFTYSQCTAVDGCKVVGRKGSENTYANDFKFTLSSAEIKEIGDIYDEMLSHLASGDDYEQFETLYVEYSVYLEYVGHQYQVASVLSDVSYTTVTERNYSTAAKLYNEMFANYYGLYQLVYDSDFSAEFYKGWSEDEIQSALAYAAFYGGSADNNNEVDAILYEYNDYMNEIEWSFDDSKTAGTRLNKVSEIYAKLVNANNTIASLAGYDNYMDYAYANEYNREYKPSDVSETMRTYVKDVIAPIFIDVAMKYNEYYNVQFKTYADQEYYCGLMYDSLFMDMSNTYFDEVKTAIDYISGYFDYMYLSAVETGGQTFDFGSAVEDLFKNGNYFVGDYQGAYTWWFDGIGKPILYFGLGDDENIGYDTAFTFVHEFGHYYENIYNGSLSLSYDHDETHSQGNEMMFLAWLSQHKPSNITNGFTMLEVDQLFDMLGNVIMSTAVDEFEQAAYTGYYNGQPISGSYADLFDEILSSYQGTYNGRVFNASQFLNSTYWAYVVFDNSAYYISYAMSALPSLELYAIAMSSGLNVARNSYIKLFTFANGQRFVATDKGYAYLRDTATYEAILNYCGLQGPFQEGLYTTLQNYFNSRTDLKS